MSEKNIYETQDGLVDAKRLLEVVWPHPECRPSLRTVRNWQKSRCIPFIQLGRLVFFDPEMVRQHLNNKSLVRTKL